MPIRSRVVAASDADIQRIVFRAFGQTRESQRFANSAIRLVARYRKLLPTAIRRRDRPASASAKARRKWLEGFEKRAFRLASDIDRIQNDGGLSTAFERLFGSLGGKPQPGFPDTGIVIEGSLNIQFIETLALGYAAREVRKTWRPRRGAPRYGLRTQLLQELAREFETSFGAAPGVRKRDPFSRVAALVLLACGIRSGDVREDIASALRAPVIGVDHITVITEPHLRRIPEMARKNGKK